LQTIYWQKKKARRVFTRDKGNKSQKAAAVIAGLLLSQYDESVERALFAMTNSVRRGKFEIKNSSFFFDTINRIFGKTSVSSEYKQGNWPNGNATFSHWKH
jgi:hypothetical protein